jgi:N-acetylated-alpha-linked acidic dipeptidase
VVEDLVPSLGNQASEVQFSSLRKAIKGVQEASSKLDAEKYEAEENFKKLLKRMRFPFPRRDGVRHRGRRTGVLRRAADWVKGVFGVPPPTDAEIQRLSIRSADSWEEYLEYASIAAQETPLEEEADVEGDKYGLPFPIREFIKAAKRVGRANRKLKAFERGFISEGGIKDREWYKHLGVAPGKWLGYGATTLPGLTEAITLEKNVTLIRYEAQRLESLLVKLAETITPSEDN